MGTQFRGDLYFLALLDFVKHVGKVPLAVITGTGGHGVPGQRHVEDKKRPWPLRGDSNGGASSSLRSSLARYIRYCFFCHTVHDRRAAGVSFQLPDGRHTGPFSVPVNYAVCSRVI